MLNVLVDLIKPKYMLLYHNDEYTVPVKSFYFLRFALNEANKLNLSLKEQDDYSSFYYAIKL
jgi:hypothetical protein